jgi:hypothetical protein
MLNQSHFQRGNASMCRYIESGEIFGVRLGMKDADIASSFGPPPWWGGKPPLVGHAITDFNVSDAWLYFDNFLVFSFDETRSCDNIVLNFWNAAECAGDFKDWSIFQFDDWPLSAVPTIGEFRAWLTLHQFPYRIEECDGTSCYIIVKDYCYAVSHGYSDCKLTEPMMRQIDAIGRVSNTNDLPSW